MIGLLCFALAVLASPFKSKLRVPAERAVVCTENLKPTIVVMKSCAYRKSSPSILVMQSTPDRTGQNASRCLGGV